DPASIKPRTTANRERYPAAWGVFTHETAHVRHTRWDAALPANTPGALLAAARILDESRIEKAHLKRASRDRTWLRAAARELILPQMPDRGATVSRWQAASAAALITARTDARILTPAEADPVTTLVRDTLGEKTLGALRTIWRAAHRIADADTTTMLTLAD